MKIVTKRAADRALVETLFQTGGTGNVERFDTGKYRGKPSDYIGRDVPDLSGVLAVYPVQQRDSDGPYVALKCIVKRDQHKPLNTGALSRPHTSPAQEAMQ